MIIHQAVQIWNYLYTPVSLQSVGLQVLLSKKPNAMNNKIQYPFCLGFRSNNKRFSVHGRIALVANASYACTKYAIEAFSDILRREMAKFDVSVSIIEPGHFGAATAVCGKAMVNRLIGRTTGYLMRIQIYVPETTAEILLNLCSVT